MQSNNIGKLPIHYVIESNDEANLFAFLVFDFEEESEGVKKSSKHYFLKNKNQQYLERTKETLFQKFYNIINKENEDIIFNIMEKLLVEMQQIVDINGECALNVVLKMENEIYKHKILKLLINYWKVHSKEYFNYKIMISSLSPFYKLLFALKERHEFEFEELFPQYIDKMKAKHDDPQQCVESVRDDCNDLLEYALNNSQRRAINTIMNCELIDANKVFIKSNDSSFDSQNAHYLMSKLLEKGFYLGNDNDTKRAPIDWISVPAFEEFLNSRINEDGKK
jgi:hypothetical protein